MPVLVALTKHLLTDFGILCGLESCSNYPKVEVEFQKNVLHLFCLKGKDVRYLSDSSPMALLLLNNERFVMR